jgi:hypothetical protein
MASRPPSSIKNGLSEFTVSVHMRNTRQGTTRPCASLLYVVALLDGYTAQDRWEIVLFFENKESIASDIPPFIAV